MLLPTNPYHCNYFNSCARRILSPYLSSHRFKLSDCPSDVLTYTRSDLVLAVQYDSDRITEIFLQLLIGTGTRFVPIWFLLPSAMQEQCDRWRFRSEPELESTLIRAQHEVLVPVAEPLWSSPDKLTYWLDRFDRYAGDLRNRDRERWSKA